VIPLSPVERRERRRRRRRHDALRWGVRVALAILILVVGIALGEALHDNPNPGDTVTVERTLTTPTTGGPRTVTP
jgi:hypothetical protein